MLKFAKYTAGYETWKPMLENSVGGSLVFPPSCSFFFDFIARKFREDLDSSTIKRTVISRCPHFLLGDPRFYVRESLALASYDSSSCTSIIKFPPLPGNQHHATNVFRSYIDFMLPVDRAIFTRPRKLMSSVTEHSANSRKTRSSHTTLLSIGSN